MEDSASLPLGQSNGLSDCHILGCGGQLPFPGVSTCEDVETDSMPHGLSGMLSS